MQTGDVDQTNHKPVDEARLEGFTAEKKILNWLCLKIDGLYFVLLFSAIIFVAQYMPHERQQSD